MSDFQNLVVSEPWAAGALSDSDLVAALDRETGKMRLFTVGEIRRSLQAPERTCPFTWTGTIPLPSVYWINADGTAEIDADFDLADYAPPVTKSYWVDRASGNNANPGTEAQPFQTLNHALTQSDYDRIYVHVGSIQTRPNFTLITRDVRIVGYGGAGPAILSEHDTLTWSSTGGTTNVSEATRTGVQRVFDASVVDADGDYEELTAVASVAACDATPGTYYFATPTIYVHPSDSRAADADIHCLLQVSTHEITSGVTVYLENIAVHGGPIGLEVSHADALLLAKDCTFKYSTDGAGISAFGCQGVYLQDCEVARNDEDGIEYHDSADGTVIPVGLEVGVTSRHNGLNGTRQTDNGSTAHAGATVVRINGEYYQNGGPNVVDVGGATSWNVGCLAYESRAADAGSLGNRQRTNFFVEDGRMWIEGGISRSRPNAAVGDASYFDLTPNRGTIYVRDLKHGNRIDRTHTSGPQNVEGF